MHPKFFDNHYYNDSGSIEAYDVMRDAHNAPVKTWKRKYENIDCAVGTVARRNRSSDMTIQDYTHTVLLTGIYEIEKGDRFVTDNEGFEIMEVQNDNMGILTRLYVKKVK